MKISYSRVSTMLQCPCKYHFGYVERIEPKRKARPLFFGSDIHSLLENMHSKKKLTETKKAIREKFEKLSHDDLDEIGQDYLTDLGQIFTDYKKHWKNTKAKPIETEHEFLIPIGGYKGEKVYFHGKIDEIYEEPIIGEHKSFTKMPSMSTLVMNMQACLYAKAIELEYGRRIEKIRWNYIKSTPAKYPIWLASKRFSEAKNSNITHYSWLRACKERGITDKNILDKAKMYEPNINNFFFKHDITLVPSMVESAWDSFMQTAKRIVLRSNKNKVKNVSFLCNSCNYQPICYAEFTGLDPEVVKKRDFKIKEKR
jgi:hypothetical protein